MNADGELAGAGFTIPVFWNGKIDDLPETIEAIIVNGLTTAPNRRNTLMAVAALVDRRYQGAKFKQRNTKTDDTLGKAP